MHAADGRGQGLKRTYLNIYARMQKGSLFTGRKTQFCDFSQKSCLFHTFFHIFSKIAYFALGVTV